jgi:poly(ADP-ribose) glycohydrolase ARH3
VVTAIDCFSCAPDSYTETVRRAIAQGGDTDTLAAMAGAISGAHLGAGAVPDHLIAALEDDHQGRTYIEQLDERLFACEKRGQDSFA